jgi:adiponectin receptor
VPEWDLSLWMRGGFMYLAGAIIYATKFPERYFPKTFDIYGASHQIFHMLVLFAAQTHFKASMQMFKSL